MQTPKHIVQSAEWAQFKSAYGTPVASCGDIFYTVHKIPFSPFAVAYCPKVNPLAIDWQKLTQSLKENRCVSINFDVPNVLTDNNDLAESVATFEKNGCTKASKNTFAGHTVVLDLTKSETELLNNLQPKHRYNVRLAQKKGVVVERAQTGEDFETFFDLLLATSLRQKYYIHSKQYYKKIWEILGPKNLCYILTAKYQGEALSSWMLFVYQGVLYYPYGGSADKLQNVFPSNLLGWEAIRLGKELGCHTFDMWGACKDLADTTDPWWGFTNFKLKFGGRLVRFMDSYDLVINQKVYAAFNLANTIRWKILKLIR